MYTNYYSIEILHGVTAIILTYHPHHAKLQVLPINIQLLLINDLVDTAIKSKNMPRMARLGDNPIDSCTN